MAAATALGVGPGGTNVPSSVTEYYDALLTTTMENYALGKTLFDNIFKDNAFLAWLKQSGAWKSQDGGERISVPLMYGKNDTVKSYEGEEQLDTTPQDGMTKAFYQWREVGGTITLTRKERRQNSGDSAIIDLLEAKTGQAEMSMAEELNRMLVQGSLSGTTFVNGNESKDLYPLGYFLRKLNGTNPTTQNVGNIDASTYTWWQHNTAVLDSGTVDTGNAFALNVSTYAGLEQALRRMYNHCSRGSGGSPDVVLMDQVTYETYEGARDTKVRFTNTKFADLGFDNIKLKKATIIWDEVVPDIDAGNLLADNNAGTAFFINTKFYKVIYDSKTNIIVTPFVEPIGQTIMSAKILFMGNAAISNMRKHGVCYAISQSITS